MKSKTGIALVLIMLIALPGLLAAQVSTQGRKTGSFSGIHNKTSADVYITRGDAVTVMVKADEDAIDELTTEVQDGVLMIGSGKSGWRSVRVMEVHITMPGIDVVKSSGSGNLIAEGTFPGNNVYVGINGSGDVKLEMDARNLELSINGSGDLRLSGVRGEMTIGISGSGDVDMDGLQLERCEVTIRGSGDVRLKGSASTLILKQMGSGDVNAYGLKASEVVAKSYGSGDAVVQAAEKIVATLNGSGDLSYYGSPGHVDVESRGSGEVYRKN